MPTAIRLVLKLRPKFRLLPLANLISLIATTRDIFRPAETLQSTPGNEADLAFPIILSSDGRVMDGMHRVTKAATEGHDNRFSQAIRPGPRT
jgi:hypothetical protein